MTTVFTPSMKILPAAQKKLWPELRPAAELGFALYGGTAIALRLGHRPSIDFDFFSENALDREALRSAFPFIALSTVLQDQQNTFTVNVPYGDSERENVKVSFFGTIAFGRVGIPERTDDGVLQVASLDDLMATKVKVILQRAEAKDYRDIAAMIDAGVSLSKGLSSARELYGINFQPSESLKAMVYFGDGDLKTLTKAEKTSLVKAASAVRDLPSVQILSKQLITPTPLLMSLGSQDANKLVIQPFSGMCVGPVVAVELERIAVQSGRDPKVIVWHNLDRLKGEVPKVGDSIEINYVNGQGVIKAKEQLRSRSPGR